MKKLILESQLLIESMGFISHLFEPSVGDAVLNKNKNCKHFGSAGKVLKILPLPKDTGKVVKYKCTNSGKNWSKGDVLSKTMDQLSPT